MFDFGRFGIVIIAGVEPFCLARCLEEFRELSSLENGLDLGDERRDFTAKISVRFGRFEKVDEFLADQVGHCLVDAKLTFDGAGGLALFDPDLVELYLSTSRSSQ